MSIVTLTLNPAIDQTVQVPGFRANAVNRAHGMQLDPGGKGVNVASYLADYGLEVAATGFLGAENSSIFESLFRRKGIADHFVRVPGNTRTNIKIADESRQQTTDINMLGAAPGPDGLEQLLQTVAQLATPGAWFVLTGSLPPDTPSAIYATLTARIKAQGGRVLLDSSGAALQEGVQAIPHVVKPNIHELQELVGGSLSDVAEVAAAARRLVSDGIALVVVSLGADGALFVDHEQTLQATPPAVTVKSTVGAGDAMVAGLLAARAAGLDLAGSARLATAFAVGAITRLGAHLPGREALETIVDQVRVSSPLNSAPSAVAPADGASV